MVFNDIYGCEDACCIMFSYVLYDSKIAFFCDIKLPIIMYSICVFDCTYGHYGTMLMWRHMLCLMWDYYNPFSWECNIMCGDLSEQSLKLEWWLPCSEEVLHSHHQLYPRSGKMLKNGYMTTTIIIMPIVESLKFLLKAKYDHLILQTIIANRFA